MRTQRIASCFLGLVVLLSVLGGCGGPGQVTYDDGQCLNNGRSLTLHEVEDEQTRVADRIASRQPWFAVITIGVVVLAAAGNAEKLLLLSRARHELGHRSMAERLRDMLVKQRDNPVRFSAIVGGSLALIVLAGSAYLYLELDKRASERALGMLQFCHLALRTKEEQGVLDEQRHNLEAIESTAGDIRSLVTKLPPAEQQKAQLIVQQMSTVLDKQGRLVGDYAAKTDEAQKDLTQHTEAMEKGLASMQGDLAGLRSLPSNLKDLESEARKLDETTTSFDGRFGDLRVRLDALESKVDTLVARPACSPPPTSSASKGSGAPSASASVSPAPSAPVPAHTAVVSAATTDAGAKRGATP